MKLPSIHGTTLSGKGVRLPEDLGPHPFFLIFGFSHGAAPDVQAWKLALEARHLPYLSVPTVAADLESTAMGPIVEAMRTRVPPDLHDTIVSVHQGGPALLRKMDWSPDAYAKVLVTDETGTILAEHAVGPYSPNAFHELHTALEEWNAC